MNSERDDKIAPTAHYTAYVWHHLGFPYADLFATQEGRAMFWGFRAAGEWLAVVSRRIPSMSQYLSMRHRLIEQRLMELRPDRVVEIGAGLSRRGITWALDHGVEYWEVDLPPMLRKKRALLEARAPQSMRARLEGRLHWEAQNVLDPSFGDWLGETLRGAERTAVIAEGLLTYFPWSERARLVSAIARGLSASKQGELLCDLRDQATGAPAAVAVGALRAGIQLVTRGRGIYEEFDSPGAVRAFFEDAGFAQCAPLDTATLNDLAHLQFPARVWRMSV